MKCPFSVLFETDKCTPKQETTPKYNTERLESDLARIQMWVGNCDQKASFLLATIGIMLALFFSTDAIVDSIANVRISLVDACINKECCKFALWLVVALILLATFIVSFASVFYLLLTLKSDTDNSKYKEAATDLPSTTFFGAIVKQSFVDYCRNSGASEKDYIQELKSQIYINASICNKKFENFNKANFAFRISLVLIFISIMILIISYTPANG